MTIRSNDCVDCETKYANAFSAKTRFLCKILHTPYEFDDKKVLNVYLSFKMSCKKIMSS